MPRALKVHHTAIGFHDGYVAAPTMNAALAAREKALAKERVRLAPELAAELHRHQARVADAERVYAEELRAWRG